MFEETFNRIRSIAFAHTRWYCFCMNNFFFFCSCVCGGKTWCNSTTVWTESLNEWVHENFINVGKRVWILTGWQDGHQYPWKAHLRHLQIRILLVRIYDHGSSCSIIPCHVLCNLLSPTFCCTFLWNNENEVNEYHLSCKFDFSEKKKWSRSIGVFRAWAINTHNLNYLPHLKHDLWNL